MKPSNTNFFSRKTDLVVWKKIFSGLRHFDISWKNGASRSMCIAANPLIPLLQRKIKLLITINNF